MIYWLANWLLRPSGKSLPTFTVYHLLIDILLVAAVAVVLLFQGLSADSLCLCLLMIYTAVISLTDFGHRIIPDRLTYSYLLLGLGISVLPGGLSTVDALIGALVGFALFYLIAILGSLAFKREAMGGGDIKLAAMLGAFIGWYGIPVALFLGSVLALLYVLLLRAVRSTSTVREVSFGPFLSVGGTVALIFMDTIHAVAKELPFS